MWGERFLWVEHREVIGHHTSCLGGAEKLKLPKFPKSSKAGHLTIATQPDF